MYEFGMPFIESDLVPTAKTVKRTALQAQQGNLLFRLFEKYEETVEETEQVLLFNPDALRNFSPFLRAGFGHIIIGSARVRSVLGAMTS